MPVNAPSSVRLKPLRRPGLRAWLDTAFPCVAALEAQLDQIASIPPSFTPIPTRNRMNKVWEGTLPGIPGTFILKLGWCNPVYSLDRRFARRVNMALQNRFLQSMELSFRLEDIGFPSVRPVLCWKKIPRFLPTEIGILYPKIEASGSLIRFFDLPPGDPGATWIFRSLPPETACAWGRRTRRLNEAELVHVDPFPSNILLRPGASDPPLDDDFVFIDSDAFRPLPAPPASPRGRFFRALSMDRAIAYFRPCDIPPFSEGFALPGESPAAWQRLFDWQRRHPRPHFPGKLLLFLRSLSFGD